MASRAGLRGRPVLGRLIGIEPARFADEFWARSPLLTTAAELDRGFDDLFSLEAADEILSTRGLRTPFIRVAKDGAIVDSSRFTGPGGVGATVGDQVIDDRIMELFTSGHTLVLQALHRFWPPLVAFAGALGTELGHPVQINAYITPKQSKGFSAHYDVHDVFVLQIAGSKRWVIHEPVHENPLRTQPWTQHAAAVASRASEPPAADHVLGEGDVLYLPRGFIHSAEALGGVSIHLTIGVHAHTRNDLVRSLLELAADDPALRQTLPLGVNVGDSNHLSADLSVTIDALVERLRSIPAADVAKEMERRSHGNRRPAPIRPLEQAAALDSLNSETRVSHRGEHPTTITEGEDGTTVEYARGTLSFPATTTAALAMLLGSDDPLRVADLAGLTEQECLDLVRRLLRAGLVVVERTEEPGSG